MVVAFIIKLKKKLFSGEPIFQCGAAFLYIQYFKLLWLWLYVDLFLNLGCYYNAVK